jgi:type 1 glutamine amidotransferase
MTALTPTPSGAPTRRATVVIAGDDVYEDLFGVVSTLQALLVAEGFAARVAMGLGRFASAAPATDDLVVICSGVGEFTREAQRGLTARVSAGLGAIFIHATAVLDEQDDAEAIALVGARYESHGPHPHESRFRVLLDPAHPITAGIAPFDIEHEHYQLVVAPGTSPLAWRAAGDGPEPLLLAREVGAGRVCYLQLGHDSRAFAEPEVANLFARAARWASNTTPEMRRSA